MYVSSHIHTHALHDPVCVKDVSLEMHHWMRIFFFRSVELLSFFLFLLPLRIITRGRRGGEREGRKEGGKERGREERWKKEKERMGSSVELRKILKRERERERERERDGGGGKTS